MATVPAKARDERSNSSFRPKESPLRPKTAWNLLRSAAGAALLVGALTGCGAFTKAGSNFGRGLASGAVDELGRPRLRSTVDTLVTSVSLSVSENVRGEIGPAVRSQLAELMADSRAGLSGIGDDLTGRIDGPLTASLERLLEANLVLVGRHSREQVHLLLTQVGDDLSTSILPQVGRTSGQAADSLVARLSIGLENQMAAAAETLAARAIRQAVLTADETGSTSRTRVWINRGFIVGIAVLVILIGVVVWQMIQGSRQRRALEALTTSIDQVGTNDLKSTIRKEAAVRNVEGWLSGYLEHQGRSGKRRTA